MHSDSKLYKSLTRGDPNSSNQQIWITINSAKCDRVLMWACLAFVLRPLGQS